MITLIDIQAALDNDEIQLFQLEGIVRKARLQEKAKGVGARYSMLMEYVIHDPQIIKTHATKEGAIFKVVCPCGHMSRQWWLEDSKITEKTHRKLSGWRR